MGIIKNAELSMKTVRRLLERNHLAYTVGEDYLLINRRFNRKTGEQSYYSINFTEGGETVGRQRIVFGYTQRNVYEDDFATHTVLRVSNCTDMAFFAFHLHDLFPDLYSVDEYNDW